MLSSAMEYLDARVRRGEIDDAKRLDLIRERANELLQTIDPKAVAPEDLWIHGDLLRSTGRYEDAAKVLARASKAAQSWDRRVNDTLRYASCLAQIGRVDEAIKAARTVFDAPDQETAPILPATLYELVPAAQGKGKDRELADLLQEAIKCQQRTKVDLASDEGKQFVVARRYHIIRAERAIESLRSGLSRV